jgi:hypothetical protein
LALQAFANARVQLAKHKFDAATKHKGINKQLLKQAEIKKIFRVDTACEFAPKLHARKSDQSRKRFVASAGMATELKIWAMRPRREHRVLGGSLKCYKIYSYPRNKYAGYKPILFIKLAKKAAF